MVVFWILRGYGGIDLYLDFSNSCLVVLSLLEVCYVERFEGFK